MKSDTYPTEGRIDAGEMVRMGPDGKVRSVVPHWPEVRMSARPWADQGDEDQAIGAQSKAEREPRWPPVSDPIVLVSYSASHPVRAAYLARQLDLMEESYVRAATVASDLMNALGIDKATCVALAAELSPDDVLREKTVPTIIMRDPKPPPPPCPSNMPPLRYRRDSEARPRPAPTPSNGSVVTQPGGDPLAMVVVMFALCSLALGIALLGPVLFR